jgi:hypothetical protein
MRYFRERGPGRSPERLGRIVRRIAPGELYTSHLQYSEPIIAGARSRNAYVVLLVRDPRAVVVSYAHYVAETPWHALNGQLGALTERERLMAAVDGLGGDFGGIGEMVSGFVPWAAAADSVLRYEDLRLDPRAAVRPMADGYRRHGRFGWSSDEVVDRMARAINPEASHTFREGRIDGWTDHLGPEMVDRIEARTRDFMDTFGYARRSVTHC